MAASAFRRLIEVMPLPSDPFAAKRWNVPPSECVVEVPSAFVPAPLPPSLEIGLYKTKALPNLSLIHI